ncbi:c-type cytochrome [Propylenella binzhouense]|uniref:c-type cytochrome n=1 Tax=Propylenella binzhouense TaxID=2555902 RepID=UPI001367B5BD|nr:cytochrome c [Propylenella binzhouense]
MSATGGAALSEIKGMPSLDATKPLGQPATPKATDSDATRPPSFTEAQVERGQQAFLKNCADCHGDQLNNGEFGGAPLVGSYFDDHWGELTVDALYGYIISAMPPDRPGRLSPQVYADIVAFILDKNGYKAGGQELPGDLAALGAMTLER